MPFTGINDWCIDKKIIKNCDIIYTRYASSDFQFVKFLKNVKRINPKIIILIEIPTYPYDFKISNTIGRLPIKTKDRLNRKRIHSYVDYVLTYSKDEKIFKINTLELSNFVNTELTLPKMPSKNTDTVINIIAVANFNYWHGYDRFLVGLYEYYKNNSDEKRKIVFHLIGDGEELIEMQKLCKET
ncbi:glycosyltransferase [Alkalibacterium sp. 20]|uniref:glycosyltransferase n=1 Tax=Alkalibacterium sp. 20 TaxID=1798803 RepID=UPI000913B734|nr:glycosyltransferase [Alkalibacterium sp. 20]OJF94676.1 hypothetical protein AX762_07280 [Alkalibacterium sp. 20]